MGNKNELIDLKSQRSLIRQRFKGNIILSSYDLDEFRVPKNFKDMSFKPKKGLNVSKVSEDLEKDLINSRFKDYDFKKIIPGVCESIKNAYEHGNLENNNLKIDLHRKFSKRGIEYIVSDQGEGAIDGQLFPYIILMRQSKRDSEPVPDFYSFIGQNYAPKGHSGIGTQVMNKCFDMVEYYKNGNDGLLVYLAKKA